MYRDARAGIVERLVELDGEIATRSSRLTPALLRLLPAPLRARIEELRGEGDARDDSLEELTRVTDARVALLEAIDEATRLAPSLAEELLAVQEGAPEAPPVDDPWGPTGTEEGRAPVLSAMRDVVLAFDPRASTEAFGPRLTARFAVEGVSLLWIVGLGALINGSNTLEPTFTFLRARHELEIAVPRAIPRAKLRAPGLVETVLHVFHRAREHDTGDRAFDDAFSVEGDLAFTRPLLSPEVRRAALAARAALGDVEVRVEEGVAVVAWRTWTPHEVRRPNLRDAIALLLALRESATSLELLRP